MDAIILIANAAVSLLTPYLKSLMEGIAKKTGEQLGARVGEAAWGKAQKVYERVKEEFSRNPAARNTLDSFGKSPNDKSVQDSVRNQLKEIMVLDRSFTEELAILLREASEAGAETVFQTTIFGDVQIQKLTQIHNVNGDVII